jgi:soluble lytic murein transglycosylase-like protein
MPSSRASSRAALAWASARPAILSSLSCSSSAARTKEAAQREGIPPALLARLLYKESYYNAKAGSRKGAKGIAQLTPIAIKELGLDPKTFQYFDPKTSIDTGAAYLARLYRRFGDWPSAVGSYNAGPDWLTRWRNGQDKVNGPSSETKTMLQRVFRGDAKIFDGQN